MRPTFLTVMTAVCASSSANAAIWTFDVTGTFAFTGQQIAQTCTGGNPACYTTEYANRNVTATYRLSLPSTQGSRVEYRGETSFGGWSFDMGRSYLTFSYTIANGSIFFPSAEFTGDRNAHFPCFPGYVGCVNNYATATATNLGFAFVSSSDATVPVPEPATWAMMMGGCGMIGAALRYRRRRVVVSFD